MDSCKMQRTTALAASLLSVVAGGGGASLSAGSCGVLLFSDEKGGEVQPRGGRRRKGKARKTPAGLPAAEPAASAGPPARQPKPPARGKRGQRSKAANVPMAGLPPAEPQQPSSVLPAGGSALAPASATRASAGAFSKAVATAPAAAAKTSAAAVPAAVETDPLAGAGGCESELAARVERATLGSEKPHQGGGGGGGNGKSGDATPLTEDGARRPSAADDRVQRAAAADSDSDNLAEEAETETAAGQAPAGAAAALDGESGEEENVPFHMTKEQVRQLDADMLSDLQPWARVDRDGNPIRFFPRAYDDYEGDINSDAKLEDKTKTSPESEDSDSSSCAEEENAKGPDGDGFYDDEEECYSD